MLDTGVFPVRVLLRVPESGVLRDSRRNRFGDELEHPVSVLPGNVAKEIVESLDDVGQEVQSRARRGHRNRSPELGSISASSSGRRIFCIARLLNPVAVHVDGVEDALGHIPPHAGTVTSRPGSSGRSNVLPTLALLYGQDRREEGVGSQNPLA